MAHVMNWTQEHECNGFTPRRLVGLTAEQPDSVARLLMAYIASASGRID
jgi:hypothetical protein